VKSPRPAPHRAGRVSLLKSPASSCRLVPADTLVFYRFSDNWQPIRGVCNMADERENPMVAWIARYDASLADKPCLAAIYDEEWRQRIRPKLLDPGDVCYLGNAFGYQAPFFEAGEDPIIRKGWQGKLEIGASVLLPLLDERERGHLIKRMRDTESTSAEEEILLAGGFSRVFGAEAITLPQASPDEPRPEFEVNADGCRILVEAKGRAVAEAIEQARNLRRTVGSLHGIQMGPPPVLDNKVEQWVRKKTLSSLQDKSQTGCGFVLVLSLYTPPDNFLTLIDMVRTLAVSPGDPACFRKNPGDLSLAEEHWALAIALVSGGSIQGVWFNCTVSRRLGIDTTTQDRIRTAVNDSFFPREDGVFFDERMSDEGHKAMKHRMLRAWRQ